MVGFSRPASGSGKPREDLDRSGKEMMESCRQFQVSHFVNGNFLLQHVQDKQFVSKKPEILISFGCFKIASEMRM